MKQEMIDIIKRIAERTIGYQLATVRREEIADNIEKLINEWLRRTNSDKVVYLQGDGLDKSIVGRITNNI